MIHMGVEPRDPGAATSSALTGHLGAAAAGVSETAWLSRQIIAVWLRMIDSHTQEIKEQNRQRSARLGKMRGRGGWRGLLSAVYACCAMG